MNRSPGKTMEITKEIFQIKRLIKVGGQSFFPCGP